MSESEAPGVGDAPPPYMIFLVVFLFFITGLLGFLICHLLKKKGYRCRTGEMEDEDEEEEEKLRGHADDEDEENQDTVEQILKCIIENEANMEAFNEMLVNHNVCVRHDPRLRRESISGVPPHHHTVHSGTDHNSCHLCAQVRSKKSRRQSRTPRSKQRPGEQTVFSVGRFRVIHTDKKLLGGPNQLISSGDQLDQSQENVLQKDDGGFNLRSMFKDVRPPLESSNGTALNVGKRRKSVTIFGLRRGSDPAGIKAAEGTGRDPNGVRFAIQQQPVVLEEPPLTKRINVTPENESKLGSKPESETTKPPQCRVNSPTSQQQTDKQACDSKYESSLTVQCPEESTVCAPCSLPVPSFALSGQTFKKTEKQEDVIYNMLKNTGEYDAGPLQTSTPIAPGPGSIPGLNPVISSGQPEPFLGNGLPVTQTPPDLSYSPDLEPGLGASLALISLGSSPPSSFPIKTPSSLSSSKTPTSPFAVTPSPKLGSRNTPSEATLTLSPELPTGQAGFSSSGPLQDRTPSSALTESPELNITPISPQSSSSTAAQAPSSPRLNVKLGSVTSITSTTLPLKEQVPEGGRILKPEEKIEIKIGISPFMGDFKGSAQLSLFDQLSKDKLSSLPLSSLLASPPGTRISSMTVISPDSKREFSVVTMVEKETSQTAETLECGGGSVPISGVGQPALIKETFGAEIRSTVSREKDDMVEMEDIRDCKVMQVEEAEKVEEELEKSVNVQSDPD